MLTHATKLYQLICFSQFNGYLMFIKEINNLYPIYT